MVCRRCRRENSPNARVCKYCNTPFYSDKSSARKQASSTEKAISGIIIFLVVVLVCILITYVLNGYILPKKPKFNGGGGSGVPVASVMPSTVQKPQSNPSDAAKDPSVFKSMPSDFEFLSGAGGWRTKIQIQNDGSFTGLYLDSEMGSVGEGYPKGKCYVCRFKGKFSTPVKVDEYRYSMQLESIELEKPAGEQYIEDETLWVTSEPYGFNHAQEFIIYKPETPMYMLPEEFVSWAHVDQDTIGTPLPLGKYGLFNVNDGYGFIPCV